jgi:hypothetical protein
LNSIPEKGTVKNPKKEAIVEVRNRNLNQSINENQFTTQSMIAYKNE